MYIDLQTIDLWVIQGELSAPGLFRGISGIIHDTDIIALGSYSPSKETISQLSELHARREDAGKIYHDSFDLNRDEHPNGRSFEIRATYQNLDVLAEHVERAEGQQDKNLFFDHLVAYRHGKPVVPLVLFHDAFSGGDLYLSGLYDEDDIRRFAQDLAASATRIPNPVMANKSGEGTA